MVLLYGLLSFVTVSVLFFCLQIFAGLFYLRRPAKMLFGDRKSVTVIVPAHNESLVITNTLKHLMPQITEHDRVIVVADNCDDNTVELAQQFNVIVLERTDKNNRGKGFALDFGLKHAAQAPSEIVVIIDADCLVHDKLIDQLAIAANKYQRPIQALYLMLNTKNCSIKQKIAEFAFLIKNKIRPAGLKVFSLPCQLMGTGMAFPWSLISQADLANGNIVEDMKLGVDFVLQKKGALFLPHVKVSSHFPSDAATLASQRTRWEHGHIGTVISYVPSLMANGIKTGNIKALAFALDLMILPLAFLALLIIMTVLLSLLVLFIALTYPIKIMASVSLLFFIGVMFSWYFEARKILNLKDLCSIPHYVFSKLNIYKRLFGDKEKGWVKTKR
jgi:cellulose synthase/poly-beta-1,6-N-acetylglucosamine synthase-like glycosyltransferase